MYDLNSLVIDKPIPSGASFIFKKQLINVLLSTPVFPKTSIFLCKFIFFLISIPDIKLSKYSFYLFVE